jgi:hypothetical protein
MTDLEATLNEASRAFCAKHTGGSAHLRLVREAMKEGALLGLEYAAQFVRGERKSLADLRRKSNLPQ